MLAARPAVEATGFRANWREIEALDEVALAVIFADHQIDDGREERVDVNALLREARPLRAVLAADARTQVLQGRFKAGDAKKVANIEKGRGPIDAADDLVAYAALYQKHLPSLRGLTAINAAQVRRASELGTELLTLLKPSSVKRDRSRKGAAREAMELRDRLWTLLVRRYAHAECAGGAAWGRSLDEHVPALQSRYVAAKKKAAKPDEKPPAG